MKTERRHYWETDTLLDPELHPVGTRLILSRRSDPPQGYEVTVVEWAPSKKWVKLQRPDDGRSYWCECRELLTKMVIEVLPV